MIVSPNDDNTEVVLSINHCQVYSSDMATLNNSNWLNDKVCLKNCYDNTYL